MPTATHGIAAVQVVVMIAAVALVTCWRTVIKYAIMAAAVTVLATVAFGAVVIWQDMQHIAG